MDGLKHFISKALKIYMPYSIVFRYLSKVEQDETERVTARCVLKAIVHQNYHIANATPVESFGDEFYSEFPDGRVSPKFFASLFMPGLLRRVIGRKIAHDLIQWLPVLDVDMLRHRLDGEELSPELFLECANLLDERRLRDFNSQDMRHRPARGGSLPRII
jgi:hypothetical protein